MASQAQVTAFLGQLNPKDQKVFSSLAPEDQSRAVDEFGSSPSSPNSSVSSNLSKPLITEGIHQGVNALTSEGTASLSHMASSAAENAAWNSAATGGETLPEIGASSYGLPALAAIIGAQQGYTGFKEGRGKGIGAALGEQARAPASYLVPTRFIGAALGSVFGGNRAKASQENNWSELAKSSDTPTSTYAKKYEEYMKSPEAEIDKKKGFDKNNLTPEDVWGGAGVLQTFGNDWLGKYSGDQRRQISQGLIDNGLIDQKLGDIVITDADKAKTIANGILGSKTTSPIKPLAPAPINNPSLAKLDPSLNTDIQWQTSPEEKKQATLAAIQPYLRPANSNFNFKGF